MKKTREELEAEIKRLQEELNPKPRPFIVINGVPQKIVGKSRIGKAQTVYQGNYERINIPAIPVVIVEDAE